MPVLPATEEMLIIRAPSGRRGKAHWVTQNGLQIRIGDLVDNLSFGSSKRRALPDAGIINQEVQPEVPQNIDHRLDFCRRSQIGVNELYVAANGRGHLFGSRLAMVVMQNYIRAFRREPLTDCSTDTSRPACY